MSPPKLLLQVRKLGHQVVCRTTLQPFPQAADRYLRQQRDQQMRVVFRHVPFHDRYFVLATYIPDQVSHSRRNLTLQRRSPTLRDPHQMQVDFKGSVRASPVFCQPRSLSGARAESRRLKARALTLRVRDNNSDPVEATGFAKLGWLTEFNRSTRKARLTSLIRKERRAEKSACTNSKPRRAFLPRSPCVAAEGTTKAAGLSCLPPARLGFSIHSGPATRSGRRVCAWM